MSKARSSPARSIAAHGVLLLYTVIALFPVLLIVMNSFKSRAAIFGSPLAPPTATTFDLIGYATVLKQGDFFVYFQNSLIVTVASLFFVLLFGAMAAFALSEYRFRGNTLMGLYLALGIMIPIRLGTVVHPADDGGRRAGQHADRADPRLHGARPAAVDLHPVGVHETGLRRPEERRPDRRPVRIHDLLPPGAAAGASGDGDGGGVHHDPDLERPLVPADPGAVGSRPRPSRSARRCSSASSSPTGTPCWPRSRWPSCRCSSSISSSRGS